jgi:predicted amidohydrolase YtcJ
MTFKRVLVPAITILAILTFPGCTKTEAPAADDGGSMIIHGGTIYLGAGQTPETGKALLVRDGRIAAIGALDELKTQAPSARLLDTGGKTVLPGLIDSHAHIDGLGYALDIVDLVDTSSFDDVLDRIAERYAAAGDDEWIEGHGWDQNDWETTAFPSAAQIDARFPDKPILLGRIDGHAAVANSAAMRLAGIDASTPDPKGGRILHDANGQLTGMFIDEATDLFQTAITVPSKDVRKRRIIDALAKIASTGLTGVHEAASGYPNPQQLIEIYKELADENAMPIRVYHMIPDDEAMIQEWLTKGPLVDYGDRLTVRAIKLYADGALGSRGAALLAPYADDPANEGILIISEDHISDVGKRAKAAGFQVGTHAIGDRGVRTALDAYEAAGVTPEDRFRIEHFQIAAIEDIPRTARMGVIAAMQPTHATSDMPWAADRLGHDRLVGGYAWRTVLDEGGHLALGSDFPVENVNPFWGIYSAVTRQDHEGHPPGGWRPEEKLTLAEAIRGFTIDSAYASFDEAKLGTIEAGKAADFTIVEGTLGEMPEGELWNVTVSATIVGGEIVYEKK